MTDVTKAGLYSKIIVVMKFLTQIHGDLIIHSTIRKRSFETFEVLGTGMFESRSAIRKCCFEKLRFNVQVINKTNFRICSWGKKRFKLRVVGKVIEMDNIYFLPKIC